MQKILPYTLIGFLMISLYACVPSVPQVDVDPEPITEEPNRGHWQVDNNKWEVEFSRRTNIGGFHLSAQSNPPDSLISSVNSCNIYYGGGLPTNAEYEVVDDEDKITPNDKYIYINIGEVLTSSHYESKITTSIKANMMIDSSGKMTITVPEMWLLKEFGDGNDSVKFSCEIIEVD